MTYGDFYFALEKLYLQILRKNFRQIIMRVKRIWIDNPFKYPSSKSDLIKLSLKDLFHIDMCSCFTPNNNKRKKNILLFNLHPAPHQTLAIFKGSEACQKE